MAVGSLGLPLLPEIRSLISEPEKNNFRLSLFSKPLDKYDFDFICDCVAGSGIKGIDLTVRKDGKVEPGNVGSVLPGLIDRADKHNLKVEMIVTGILSDKDPYTLDILKTASDSGVKYYRLGWFAYDSKADIWETLQKNRAILDGLTALNQKFNIHGGYQNHSGELVGGPVWDLHELFRGLPPEFLGSQFDVRHAMVEGYDTWTLGMRLIAGHIRTLAIKDFAWKMTGSKPEPVTVPLGEGMIDWDLFFKMVKDLKINAPITLHVEYPLLEKSEENLSLIKQQEIIIPKLKKDTDFINLYLKKYELI
jgi:L-ribulose-5-phosphate 3-epimerase